MIGTYLSFNRECDCQYFASSSRYEIDPSCKLHGAGTDFAERIARIPGSYITLKKLPPFDQIDKMAFLSAKEKTDEDGKKAEPLVGEKADAGKIRFSLLPLQPVIEIIKVLEYGAKKYAPDNWQKVPHSRTRYFDACQRHILAWWDGEKTDPESGLPHLAHAACCLLFLMWGDEK